MAVGKEEGWRQVSVGEALGKKVFSEDYGFGIPEVQQVVFRRGGAGGMQVQASRVLVTKTDGTQQNLMQSELVLRLNSGKITPVELYGSAVLAGVAPQPDTISVTVAFREVSQPGFPPGMGPYGPPPVRGTFTLNSAEEFEDMRLWTGGDSLPSPRIGDIRVGNTYYLEPPPPPPGNGRPPQRRPMGAQPPEKPPAGKATVTRVYDFPNTAEICDVTLPGGKTATLREQDVQRLRVLPSSLAGGKGLLASARRLVSGGKESAADSLERGTRELELQPYAERDGHSAVICWLALDGAASYQVTLYRRVAKAGYAPLYHLEDYELDRGTHFLSLSGLVGTGYLFRVTALDRAGRELARTRGINL